jgi:hypothetical protein
MLRARNIIATAIGTVSAPSRRILSPPKRLARNFVLGLPRHEIQTKWWQVTANDIQEGLKNRIRARLKDNVEIDEVGDKAVLSVRRSDTSFLLLASLHTQTANTTTDTNTRIAHARARARAHTHTLYQITRKLLQMMILDFDTLKLVTASDLANEPSEAKMTEFQVQVSPSLPPFTTASLPPSLHTHMRQLSDTKLQPTATATHSELMEGG